MHICPCSRTQGICKNMMSQEHILMSPEHILMSSEHILGLMEYARTLGFGYILARWRSNLRGFSATLRFGATNLNLSPFLIAPKNCIFWGASFELIKHLATLNPKKLQGFHGTYCYTLAYVRQYVCVPCRCDNPVYMYIYIYIWTYIHIYIYLLHKYRYECDNPVTSSWLLCLQQLLNIYVCACLCRYVCMYICMCVCARIPMFVSMCVCCVVVTS